MDFLPRTSFAAQDPGPHEQVLSPLTEELQGYLAHRKTQPPRTLQQAHAWGLMVVKTMPTPLGTPNDLKHRPTIGS